MTFEEWFPEQGFTCDDEYYCRERMKQAWDAALTLAQPEAASSNDAADAAVAFRDSLAPKADEWRHGAYPLWHGWALYEAFLAGVKWHESRRPQKDES